MKSVLAKLPQRLRSAASFAFGTLISRLFGFTRDVAFANYFGSSPLITAFLVAFQIPNFTRRLFAEGAFSQAFIPALKSQSTLKARQQLIDQVFIYGGLAIIGLTGVAWCLAPVLVKAFAPGFMQSPQQFNQTVHLLRITLFFIPFISVAAFAAAILQCNRYFYITSIPPIFLNLCLILAAYYSQGHAVDLLAYAVSLSGALQCLFLFAHLRKIKALPSLSFTLPPFDATLRKMGRMMRTTLLSASVSQLSLVIDTIIASFLPLGSIAWLYYSQRLVYLPLGLFAVAISTIVLPELTQDLTKTNNHRIIRWGFKLNGFLGLPACVGLACLAGPCILTLFAHGQFSIADVKHTQYSLWAFCLGLPAFMIAKTFSAAFYAAHQPKIPFKAGLKTTGLNIIASCLLIIPFQHAGIALGTSIASWTYCYLLYRHFPLALQRMLSTCIKKDVLPMLCASLCMGILLYILCPHLATWQVMSSLKRISYLFFLIFSGGASYLMTVYMMNPKQMIWHTQLD